MIRSALALALASVGLVTLAVTTAPATASPFPTGASSRSSSGEPPVQKAAHLRCVKRKTKRKPLCGGPFKDNWRKGWWSRPPEFQIVDVSILGSSTIEALSDDGMRFNGEGEIWISARKGFGGRFKLPKPTKSGIGIGTATAKPVDWTSRSTGAWITSVGDEIGCGTTLESGPLVPSRLTALIATNRKKDELNINWNLAGPAYKCPKDRVDGPPFDEKFSDSSLIRYRASSFRGHKLLRLPIKAKWSNESNMTRTTVEWSGHVLLRRVK